MSRFNRTTTMFPRLLEKKSGDNDELESRKERIRVSIEWHCVDRTKCGLLLL